MMGEEKPRANMTSTIKEEATMFSMQTGSVATVHQAALAQDAARERLARCAQGAHAHRQARMAWLHAVVARLSPRRWTVAGHPVVGKS